MILALLYQNVKPRKEKFHAIPAARVATAAMMEAVAAWLLLPPQQREASDGRFPYSGRDNERGWAGRQPTGSRGLDAQSFLVYGKIELSRLFACGHAAAVAAAAAAPAPRTKSLVYTL